MGRKWVGYDPTCPPEVNFERNRGLWRLRRNRIQHENYVVFSWTVDKEVKLVAKIDGLTEFGDGKRALEGYVLPPDHPLWHRFVGSPAPDDKGGRNPVHYLDDPGEGSRLCGCGCGVATREGRAFLPGHDKSAVHHRIKQGWGSTLAFVRWFDENWPRKGEAPRPPGTGKEQGGEA